MLLASAAAVAMLQFAAAVVALAGSDPRLRGGSAGQPAPTPTISTSPADWVYVASTPGGAGPRRGKHEQLWIGPDRVGSWRAVIEQEVIAAADRIPIGLDEIARLRSAAHGVPSRPRLAPDGPSQGAIDGWMGPSLIVALGTTTGFDRWSGVEASLPPLLVSAARAILGQARPSEPKPPDPEMFWVQCLPLDPAIESVFERDHLIVDLPADGTDTSDTLRQATRSPFRWVQVPTPPIRILGRVELSLRQPAAAVRISGVAYQWVLQHGPHSR